MLVLGSDSVLNKLVTVADAEEESFSLINVSECFHTESTIAVRNKNPKTFLVLHCVLLITPAVKKQKAEHRSPSRLVYHINEAKERFYKINYQSISCV